MATSESNALMVSPSSMRPPGHISTATPCPSLPADIWQIIFSVGSYDELDGSFWSHYDYPDLASICHSCTLFCNLIRPVLYYRFVSHVMTQIYHDDESEWQLFSIVKFAWTISTNPHLASLVRQVEIRGVCDALDMDMDSEPIVPLENYPDHPMASALTNRAAELGMVISYYEGYTNVHSPQNVGFDLVALILAQLPMLDAVNLKWFGRSPIARIPEPRGVWPWSESIRNMTLEYLSSEDPTESYSARCLRRVPDNCLSPVLPIVCSGTTLTRLTLQCSAGPSFVLPLENLREVIIIDCQFRPGQFLNLLGTCTNLVKFAGRRFEMSLSSEIIEALEPANSSLQVLGLCFSDVGFWPGYGPRISSLKQFTALKTLSLDMPCIWNQRVARNKNTPPNPDMLLTTLLPESIEEVALVNEGVDDRWTFEFEAHVKRLGLERRLNGRFQHLKWLHGASFTAIVSNLESDIDDALLDDDEDEVLEILNHAARRFATLIGARKLMLDAGVEFSFDCREELDCDCDNDPLILGHGI